VVKEAATLGRAGHDVTVLSISTHERFERIDRVLMQGQPFRRTTLDYSVPRAAARTADLFQRAATWAARRACASLGFETAQALGPASALLRRARAQPADLTIVHTEIPLWIARHLIADGRRVAVDVEDWYSEDLLYSDRQTRPLRLLRRAEEFALRHAVYASATSQSMADGLTAAFHCRPPIVIRNTFPLQEKSRATAAGPNPVPRFIWFSQTIGAGRGLELFLAAWARTVRPSRVYLLGDERPGYREKLLGRLPPARREHLQFIPLVSPDELPLKLAEFDVGLALEPDWPVNRDVTITNKIFQYLNAGLAIVASRTAGQLEVMRAAPACGLLVTAHETAEYAAALDTRIGDPDRLRGAQLAARAAAEGEFCWEREAPRLVAAVDRALR
jgi:glycosyltransferase involved in cell wall biosynthesis